MAVTLVVSMISSLGAPLLPAVASSLEVSVSAAQWSLTSALVAGAVAAPILGRLGDGPRRREAIVLVLATVTAGGLLAGFAPSLPLLIAGRVMQGTGLGLVPIAIAIARNHLPAAGVPAVIGLLSVSAAAGVGVGYPLSGLIAAQFDVFAAYLFGAVISAGALALVYVYVPSSTDSSPVQLDLAGAVLAAAGLVPLLIAIGQGAEWGWSSPPVLACLGLAVVLLSAWVRQQLRTPVPLVQLRLLKHQAVLGGDGAALLLGIALYMFLTAVTGFVQVPPERGFGFGSSTLVAGLMLVPFSVVSLLATRLMWTLEPRIGARAVLSAGSLLVAAGGIFFSLGHDELWEGFATMGILGLGFGFTFAAIPGLLARAVPKREVGSVMGFYQVVRSIGFSVGSALVASILAAHQVAPGGTPAESGYVLAAWIGAAVGVLGALWAAFLTPSGKGSQSEACDQLALEDAELAELSRLSRAGSRKAR